MKDQFKLTIAFDINAFDTIEARIKARRILVEHGLMNEFIGKEQLSDKARFAPKLQQVFKDRQPEKIEL